MVMATQATVVCIQETKLQVFDERLVNESLGQSFREKISFLPSCNWNLWWHPNSGI
jgi:hypothetical protein